MFSLGFVLQKNFVYHAVLSGNKQNLNLQDKGRQATYDPDDTPNLMYWYDSYFRNLIAKFKPARIGYKVTLDPTLHQQHYLSFPLGILNQVARENSTPISEFSSRAMVPSKIGYDGSTNLMVIVDNKFGTHPPYWDKQQKEAIVVAWMCL